MSTLHRIRAAVTTLLSGAATFILLAPAALAQVPAPEPTFPAQPTHTATISHGWPLWVFAIVAIAAVHSP